MKNRYISKIGFCLRFFLLLFSFSVIGQTEEQKKALLEQYDLPKIKQLQLELSEKAKVEKEKALFSAKANQLEVFKKNADGSVDELMGLFPDGKPKYFSINNINAAISTRANQLHSGGGLGLNLNGQGMIGGVWDGGPTRTSHQEFGGRMAVGDGAIELNGNSFHATHVTGTVGASGVDFDAKGMAFQATIKTFDWTQDEAEVLGEIQNGLLLSNHSYGTRLFNVPSWYAGAYSQDALQWDMIHYVSPYYLMVVAAGNDGNIVNENPTTIDYDKLTGHKNGKNNLVVANGQDAEIDSNGNLISVNINSASSEGPTDDLRIKPDITGNGTGVYSTNSSGDEDYTTLSGTSMASPNVMGTLILLQQHHNNLYQKFMKSATLKGLACHTADDAGNPGPDAIFGWGLLNAKTAANTISNNGLNTWISEESLTQNQVYTKTIKSIAGQPLVATICWTDIPGIANTGTLNDPTPAIVHDLDIRITQGSSTFYPWRLQANAAQFALRNGDNFVDTVETIMIDNANGSDYTLTISHKGTLQTNKQDYSLIISGIDSDFGFVPLGYDQTVCSSENATFSFTFTSNESGNVSFSVIDIPEGAVTNLSETTLSNSGNFELIVSNLSAVEPGNYSIGIVASNTNESETRYVNLKVLSSEFELIDTISPSNGQIDVATSATLTWEEDVNAENYVVEVSTEVTFNTLFWSETTENTFVNVTDLNSQTVYYWRVKPSNRCGDATTFFVSNFQTGIFNCGLEFTATDFSDAFIDNVANSVATIPIIVSGGITIADINVSVDISHSWVQDMSIYLIGPPEIGSPSITLFEEPCGGEDDILATIDDSGSTLNCGSNPAISGIIKPNQPLSDLNGLLADGIWTLYVIDKYNNDGGVINAVSLSFCNSTSIENNLSFSNNGIITEINTTKIILTNEINASTPLETSMNQAYTLIELPSLGVLKKETVNLVVGDSFTQEDVNLNKISYTNSLTEEATDSFMVNIENASSGWLPNVVIPITIQDNLSLIENASVQALIYPNPSNGKVTVSWSENIETTIDLFDLQGRIILSKKINSSNIELDINQFSEGIYLISVRNEKVKTMKKIMLKK
ncbi:S8 family serine peptidase [Flavobacterium azooxidireducens]|uniref:S8 family serine peptidase n=1 Tax=Flavobacterium azooxidireducens TaxID=1871076 RepID=A0ABY4KIH3_9FLAO|nr:S8 family serine peptidase [Flavobacterium azooxidireducens]UPQ80646.1 S8 family serine peptidase [Flavobacterium azooxidireducens]